MSVTSVPKPETISKPASPENQYVYFFGAGKAEGNGKMKDELGGKGAGLAEMTNAGLPVPPGFTIQTAACREYMKTGKVAEAIERQMSAALATVGPISAPTLYVWSTGDVAIGRRAAEATAEWVTGPYRFVVLEDVSHWIPETAPNELNRSLLDHLATHR